jgi:hypothetical protein|tara:strand:- start:1518 stop:1742 length:225 start_codon:yes stop_codon:yes gene_type:complete
MNKEFPFVLRKGFDNGVLRRCAVRPLHLPPMYETVEYQDDDGNLQKCASNGQPAQTGMELRAFTDNGQPIHSWW